jgi:hypothetical protein
LFAHFDTALFEEKIHPDFGGIRPHMRVMPVEGKYYLDTTKSSEAHVFHVYSTPGRPVAMLRYKTSLGGPVWLPLGCNGATSDGVGVFKDDVVLPTIGDVINIQPAPFETPFKNEDKVKETILSLHDASPLHMPLTEHNVWKEFFRLRPATPFDIPEANWPMRELRSRTPETRAPSGVVHYNPLDRSILDPMDNPVAGCVTGGIAADSRVQRRRNIRDQCANRMDTTPIGALKVNDYHFVAHDERDGIGFRLPISLARVIEVVDGTNGLQARVMYQSGDHYDGWFRPFRIERGRGDGIENFQTGTIEVDMIVLAHVTRGKGKSRQGENGVGLVEQYTDKFMLADSTRGHLKEITLGNDCKPFNVSFVLYHMLIISMLL